MGSTLLGIIESKRDQIRFNRTRDDKLSDLAVQLYKSIRKAQKGEETLKEMKKTKSASREQRKEQRKELSELDASIDSLKKEIKITKSKRFQSESAGGAA